MSNDYKFDLKKFNKNFDLYDNILLDKIIYENQEYLNNKKYLKKKFNPFDYSINTHIKYFIDNIYYKKLILNDIINDDMILFHI